LLAFLRRALGMFIVSPHGRRYRRTMGYFYCLCYPILDAQRRATSVSGVVIGIPAELANRGYARAIPWRDQLSFAGLCDTVHVARVHVAAACHKTAESSASKQVAQCGEYNATL